MLSSVHKVGRIGVMELMVKYWQIMLCMDVEEWVEQHIERQIGNLVLRSWAKLLECTWKKIDVLWQNQEVRDLT